MNKGNRKAQRKRRRARQKNLPEKQKERYELIDGNFTHYPVAYCWRYGAWLSQGLADTHRCRQRKCRRFEKIEKGVLRDGKDVSKAAKIL